MPPNEQSDSYNIAEAFSTVNGDEDSIAGTPQADADGGSQNKRPGQDETDDGSGGMRDSQRVTKKVKRGKYVSRACASCQKRKIKCEGGEPCAQCVARNQPCISTVGGNRIGLHQKAGIYSASEFYYDGSVENSIANRHLVARLTEVERRLGMIARYGQETMPRSPQKHLHPHTVTDEDHTSQTASKLQDVMEPDGQTFAGELSMKPAFYDQETGVNEGRESGKLIPDLGSGSPPQNMNSLGKRPTRKVRAWLEAILDQHGVVADEENWRRYMQVFLDEVYILYPILHQPTLWETFNELWEYSALWPLTTSAERDHKRMSIALVYFCLALGRGSISSRIADENGVHSAGWTLYCVGMSLLQDTVETSNSAAKTLVALQILVIRVLYLFRLDATQRAARLLSLSISNCYSIGLHRQSALETMPVFQSQLYCRTWWAIYILDRRLAIESGRPYLIQDSIVDTTLPLELSDEWMSCHQSRPEATRELQTEIADEVAGCPVTPIPYLTAMVRYSRVMGKAWELLYGINATNTASSGMIEYADMVLCNILQTLPQHLSYDPKIAPAVQFRTRLRWQIKQTMLLFTYTTVIRLLIRRPFSPSSKPPGSAAGDDELENVTVCAGLAASILRAHDSLQDNSLKHSFPLSHYLTSAIMVMIEIITREPSLKRRYRDVTLAATRSLNMYCHVIWVSGKMMRLVSKLTSLVHKTLGNNSSDYPSRLGQSGGRGRSQDMHQQQLTPQSESRDYGQASGQGSEYPDKIKEISADGYRSWSRPDGRGSIAPKDHESGRSISDGTNLSSSWMMDTGVQPPRLADWALPDFNLETVISGDSLEYQVSPLALFTASGDGTMRDVRHSTMQADWDNNEVMFGPLGPN